MTSSEYEFPRLDRHDAEDADFPIVPDNLSEWENAGQPPVLGEFIEVPCAPEVRLRGKPFSFLSAPGENVPDYVIRDCATLSYMALRAKYESTATSHRKMLERAPAQGRYVHPHWRDFRDFLRSQGPRLPKTTLDRINNEDPEYGPGKCRWATKRVQNNNKGDTLEFTHSVTDEKWKASELAKREGVSINAIEKRLARHWTHDEIIEGRRRPKFPQAPVGCAAPLAPHDPKASAQSALEGKEATKYDNQLAGQWEQTMRQLAPTALAPLTEKERARLRAFGVYLVGCNLSHDKAGILDFILDNWTALAMHAACDAGYSRHRAPTTPCPIFLAEHMRRFVNRLRASYKPVDISSLQFGNEDEPPAQQAASVLAKPTCPSAVPPRPYEPEPEVQKPQSLAEIWADAEEEDEDM